MVSFQHTIFNMTSPPVSFMANKNPSQKTIFEAQNFNLFSWRGRSLGWYLGLGDFLLLEFKKSQTGLTERTPKLNLSI